MIRAETTYTPGGKQMTVRGPRDTGDDLAGFWKALTRRPAASRGTKRRKLVKKEYGPVQRSKAPIRAVVGARWGGGIPMRKADMNHPAGVDWEKVAALGARPMAEIKAAVPDFL